MERKISDMMDHVRDDRVELTGSSPLSARRIRRMTLERTESKRSVSLRWLGKVAVVAAVFMALTVTVFATDVVLGEGKLLGRFFGNEFSDRQMEVVEDIGRGYHESVTDNGATITPIEAISDANNLYLHIQIEAPEGVVLPDLDEEEGYFYDFEPSMPVALYDQYYERWGVRMYYFHSGHQEWMRSGPEHEVKALKDEDPTDNVKEFVVRLTIYGDSVNFFNGTTEKYIVIKGLFIRKRMDTYTEEVLRGNFPIDITIQDENWEDMKLVVDVDDLTIYNEEYDFTTTIKKIEITPLTITVEYDSTEANDSYVFPKGGPIQLVMKDGSIVDAVDAYYNAAEHSYPHPDSVVGVCDFTWFDDVIVLEDIDYILVDGQHRIDIDR